MLAIAHCTGYVTATYPQNLCITMWTECPRFLKHVVQPRVCIEVIILSPCRRKSDRQAVVRARFVFELGSVG
jgi:hypothetical protein